MTPYRGVIKITPYINMKVSFSFGISVFKNVSI